MCRHNYVEGFVYSLFAGADPLNVRLIVVFSWDEVSRVEKQYYRIQLNWVGV